MQDSISHCRMNSEDGKGERQIDGRCRSETTAGYPLAALVIALAMPLLLPLLMLLLLLHALHGTHRPLGSQP
jgi:hypothetical protein